MVHTMQKTSMRLGLARSGRERERERTMSSEKGDLIKGRKALLFVNKDMTRRHASII